MTQNDLTKKLQTIIDTTENSIERAVAKEALDADDIQHFFSDLLGYGCVSGMISSLIYYVDTHAFFDTHYDHIQEALQEYEANHGEPFKIKGDLKNSLAWFAFEYSAYELASQLELL